MGLISWAWSSLAPPGANCGRISRPKFRVSDSKTVRRKARVCRNSLRTDCEPCDYITALILTILHNPVGHGAAVFGSALSQARRENFPFLNVAFPRGEHSSAGSLFWSKADLTALKCDFTPEAGHSGPWLQVAVSDLSGTKLRTGS
jgi:hypothetical protein